MSRQSRTIIVCRQSSKTGIIHRVIVGYGIRYESNRLGIIVSEEGEILRDVDIETEREVYGRSLLELLSQLNGSWLCYEWDLDIQKELSNFVLNEKELISLVKFELNRIRKPIALLPQY